MKLLIFLTFFNVFLVPPGMCNTGKGFCYEEEDCGPKNWQGVCKTGTNQSPIDIPVTRQGLRGAEKAEFYFSNDYWHNQDFILKNNGHTVQASSRPDLTSTSYLVGKGNSLNGKKYIFSQLHFHWGSNDYKGTEHSFNNKKSAMEGHFVHYSSEFGGLAEAVESSQANALSVVGVMYKISFRDNPAFSPILKAMRRLKNSGDSTQGTNLNLVKLLPPYETVFNFQYNGSLTTPGCGEVVLWNVLRSGCESYISERQLKEFRSQMDAHEGRLQNNFRPTQPVNNREIRVYDTKKVFIK